MAEKNHTSDFGLPEFLAHEKERREKIDQSYAEYRKSGLALMSTIIGLSTGVMYITEKIEYGIYFSRLFILTVFVALLQELFHYLGSMYEARWHFSLHLFLLSCALQTDATKHKTEIESYSNLRDKFFLLADVFCVAAVILFGVAVGVWYVGR